MAPATIGKPAPAFSANSVQPDGSFKTVSLSDFKGTAHWKACVRRGRARALTPSRARRQVHGAVLLPAGLHLRLPGTRARAALRALWPSNCLLGLSGMRCIRLRGAPLSAPARVRRAACADGDHRLLRPRQGVRGDRHCGAQRRAQRPARLTPRPLAWRRIAAARRRARCRAAGAHTPDATPSRSWWACPSTACSATWRG